MAGLSLPLLRPAALLLPMLLIGVSDGLADPSMSPIGAQTAPTGVLAPDGSLRADTTVLARCHYACSVILRLNPSQKPYEACVTSLQRSAAAAQVREVSDSRRSSCVRDGFLPGTPAFATCIVKGEGDASRPRRLTPMTP
jgi:hypothetical protein